MDEAKTTQSLVDFRTMLLDCIAKAEEILRNVGGVTKIEMEAYLLPHLRTWAENLSLVHLLLDDANIFTDPLRSALDSVDWREIIHTHEHEVN